MQIIKEASQEECKDQPCNRRVWSPPIMTVYQLNKTVDGGTFAGTHEGSYHIAGSNYAVNRHPNS